MSKMGIHRKIKIWLAFLGFFSLSLAILTMINLAGAAKAAPSYQEGTPTPATSPAGAYAGSSACSNCHKEIHAEWISTRHAQAFSSPIFQRDWSNTNQDASCLECHTTGYDPVSGGYSEEGVTCESCHGPFQPNHPAEPMPLKPDADLCSHCHKGTTDEWRASRHSENDIQCQACHNPHSQKPMAESVTALCSNCHKERGGSFTHSTHSSSGLECSNCHMYTAPRTEDPIMGLVPTGHTFTVGSDACIGCHQDSVHTRDELIKLSGQAAPVAEADTEALKQTIAEQQQAIDDLQASSNVRLYTGLIQGAIVGLVTGGVAAWVVSRRIRVVEVDEDE
jgi:predicted CXXCH cytochrome family protein